MANFFHYIFLWMIAIAFGEPAPTMLPWSQLKTSNFVELILNVINNPIPRLNQSLRIQI